MEPDTEPGGSLALENTVEPVGGPVVRRRERNRSRGWCFTWNNHTESDIRFLIDHAANMDAKYIFQEETGDSGTPHLQGLLYFRTQVAFTSLKQWTNQIHWERTANVAASVRYCSDASKRSGRIYASGYSYQDRDLRIVQQDNLYDWQSSLLQEFGGVPDMRSIIWYTDTEGGCGKTALCRYLVANTPNVLFVSSGAAKDILYQVIKNKWDPHIVIFNLPRTSEAAMSYTAIEQLKDGLLFCGKYEGGIKLFPPPHVVIFANFLPDLTKLSQDRWVVRTLLKNPTPHVLSTTPFLINGLPPT